MAGRVKEQEIYAAFLAVDVAPHVYLLGVNRLPHVTHGKDQTGGPDLLVAVVFKNAGHEVL